MFHLLTNRKFLVVFGVIALVIFVISLIIKPPTPLPSVINTSPANNSTKVNYFDKVSYTLDSDIDHSALTLTSIPEENWQKSPMSSREIIFSSAQYLHVNTQYTLTLNYQDLPIHSLTFTTAPQQSDPRYTQEVVAEVERDYPLATKTPYEEPGFGVVYSAPLNLEITILSENVSQEDVLGAVREWVRSNGLDPSSHTYTFAN